MSQSANYIFFCISWDFTLFHCRKAPLRKKGLYILFMNCNYSSYTQGIQKEGGRKLTGFFSLTHSCQKSFQFIFCNLRNIITWFSTCNKMFSFQILFLDLLLSKKQKYSGLHLHKCTCIMYELRQPVIQCIKKKRF